jgi:hypothetical protein
MGSSEELVGKFLKANTKLENMVIATKLNEVMRDDPNGKGLSRKEIFRAGSEFAALADGLCGLVPDSPLGLRDADRGDTGGVARCGEIREGILSLLHGWEDFLEADGSGTENKKLVKDIPVEVLGHIEAHALCCGDGTVALVKIEAKKTA